jgi:hypothetical protein
MEKEDIDFELFILIIIVGFIFFVNINHNAGDKCKENGDKAIYTWYGIYEKCID